MEPIDHWGVQLNMSRRASAIGSLSTFLVGLLIACSSQELPDIENAARVSPRCEGKAEDRYFHPENFRALPFNQFVWPQQMGRMLDAMREPALSCGDEPDSYRILWLHSFPNWGSAMVRVSRRTDSWWMTAVQFGNSLKHDEVLRRERLLSDAESAEMLAAINRFGLWSRQDFAWNRDVLDGGSWMIEGRRGALYHPVFLVNADEDQARRLAFTFWNFAGIKTKLTDD